MPNSSHQTNNWNISTSILIPNDAAVDEWYIFKGTPVEKIIHVSSSFVVTHVEVYIPFCYAKVLLIRMSNLALCHCSTWLLWGPWDFHCLTLRNCEHIVPHIWYRKTSFSFSDLWVIPDFAGKHDCFLIFLIAFLKKNRVMCRNLFLGINLR